MLLPLAIFSACSDDDDLPNVDITTTFSNVTKVENKFYAVAGDEITIDAVKAVSLDNKQAAITNLRFAVDGYAFIFPEITEADELNYSFSFDEDQVGNHVINVVGNVLQVDKSIATTAFNIPIVVVAAKENLPADAPELGTYSMTFRTEQKK